MNAPNKPRIALWFRYGPAEHAELFHAMPDIVEELAQHAEVHYFGLRSRKPVPDRIAKHATIHHLPFTVDRTRDADKAIKTLLWILSIPRISRECRKLGVQAVYIDETVPLTAPLALRHFGPNVAFTIADLFVDIYAERSALVRAVAGRVKRADMNAWRKLPLIFTRAKSTRDYLARQGINPARVHPVYDPCDFSIYHPGDRDAARVKYGFAPEHIVLVHHGILHPNKGNDRIIRALAECRDELPGVRYLLVGDGPDMARLRALVLELGVEDRVTFTGWLPTLDDVNVALNAGDIGLVMRVGQESDDFHMTGALVHSMACGLPILAARLGGVSEVIRDGENGLLFDPRDMTEFRAKLKTLAGDPPLRSQFGQSALALAKQIFDMKAVTENTVRPLLELARAGK